VLAKELGWIEDDTDKNGSEDRFPNLDHQLSILLEARRSAVEKEMDNGGSTTGSSTTGNPQLPGVEESNYSASNHNLLRGTIYGQPFEYDPTFKVPTYTKTNEEEEFLRQALQKCFIFATLGADELQQLIGSMQRQVVSTPGTQVIVQGTVGDYFYVVQSGKIDFVKGRDNDEEVVGSCEAGGSFGELALLYATPRAVSCVATEAW
jgi:cAMP-dependent protein kinase regulator